MAVAERGKFRHWRRDAQNGRKTKENNNKKKAREYTGTRIKPQDNHETFFNFDTFLRVVVVLRIVPACSVLSSWALVKFARCVFTYWFVKCSFVPFVPLSLFLDLSFGVRTACTYIHAYIRTDFFNLFLFASARCLTVVERWRSYP